MRYLLALLLTAALLTTSAAQAEDFPSYLVLRAPVAPKHHHDTHGYYPGRAYAVETQAYNYGWFGAKTGSTWSRSFGYSGRYTQWTKR